MNQFMKIKIVSCTVRTYIYKGAFYIYTLDDNIMSMSLLILMLQEAPKAEINYSSLFEILKGILGFKRNLWFLSSNALKYVPTEF